MLSPCSLFPVPALPKNENGDLPAAVVATNLRGAYFTPCINFWINGAIRNKPTPPIIRMMKPCV